MSELKAFKTLAVFALLAGALLAAACTIDLGRHDDQPIANARSNPEADPAASDVERCRTISYEQKDRLAECRKLWATRQRQFLGQYGQARNRTEPSAPTTPFFKDQGRLPSELFPAPPQSDR